MYFFSTSSRLSSRLEIGPSSRLAVSPQCTKYAFGLRAKYAWVPDGDLASEYLMSFDSPPKPDKFRNLEANTDTILSFIKEWMIYLTDSDRDQ